METFDAVIVGAGFSGLYLLHSLREEGLSVRLVEAQSGLGGVWQANRYPGARVDSHVPNYEFSMEPCWRDWVWSERFPGRDELVRYFEHIDRALDLSRDIDLETRIKTCRFDGQGSWTLIAEGGRRYSCSMLLICTGFGSIPYTPDLAGLKSFAGTCHHTATWPEGGVDFLGQRVGIIGTGASGVQVIQEVAPLAERLTVFQRTPNTALPMQQRRLKPASQAAAKVNYPEMFARRNVPPGNFCDIVRPNVGAFDVTETEREEVFETAWQWGGFRFWIGTFNDILIDEAANRTAYDFWRDKTRARVDDPIVADLLAPIEPPYPFGTKRPSLEQNFYECFNRPNVELVDLRATPVETIEPAGLQTSDALFELDVLVLATGFDANTGGLTAIDIRGTDDRTLADAWAGGVETHLGMSVPGFPNMLMLYGPQSATAFCNGPTCAEFQGDWVTRLLQRMRRRGEKVAETTVEMGQAWSAHLAELSESTLFGRTDSWYMAANIPGKKRQLLNYPNSDAYRDHLSDCEANGYEGFVFR
ncbi:MAG: cyclopentanone 1,2-monooxygenase [Rhodospirillaceae bacterium]|nr:cyclopentanone 1,2-monooxygenase [Rhodospirillaceae bacterium]|tara:strand:- start:1421 stop:3013 length:1593 start_codon:yes stop_codon:yes gene_type:complete